MSLTLNFGSQSTDLTSASDLVKFLTSNVPAELKFATDPTQSAAQTLQDIGNTQVSLNFSTSKQLSWDLGTSGNVTFGFSPSASGGVSIQTSGTLFTYTLADGSQPVAVPVPANTGYVSITFNVSLGVSAGGSFSSGNFGVSANASASSTFAVAFRKAFPLTTPVVAAITQAFESFTFPFQPAGLNRVNDGDFLDYEYLGSIQAGFGVNYGVSGNLLGGRSVDEITQSFNASPIGKAVVNVKPTFQAAASFAFAYDDEEVFHVILARHTNTATLLYFRSDSTTVSTTETLGITLNTGASFNLTSNLPTAAGKIASAAVSKLGGNAASGLANTIATDTSGAVQDFIDDVNTSVNSFLSKGDGQTIQLQLQQERLNANTALFSFEFDLTQPDAVATGYPLAVAGNFAAAIQITGVDLDPGSFVEHQWVQSTSVAFQFFDLFMASDVTQYFQDTKLVYAGNKTFRLIFKTGVKDIVTINSAENDCEVYFSATAPADAEANVIGDLVVKLNFVTVDHSSNAAQETKRALTFIGGPALRPAVAAIPAKLNGSLTVNCQFSQSAFSQLNCDDYVGKKPSNLPHPVDAANYMDFLAAVQGIVPPDNINSDFLRFFGSYDSWIEFNRVKIDQEGSTITPDRKSIGNVAVNRWPEALISIDESERVSLQCYIYADQAYMNLCDSLKHLASDLAAGTFNDNIDLLESSLTAIIKQNISVFFIKPALAALFRSSQCSASSVQLTQTGGDITIAFVADSGTGAARRLAAGI
jgi:hypothetical protein